MRESGEDADGALVREQGNVVGKSGVQNLPSGTRGKARAVHAPDDGPGNENDDGKTRGEATEGPPAAGDSLRSIGRNRFRRSPFAEGEQREHGEDEDPGEFGDQGQTGSETHEEQTFAGWGQAPSIEGIDGGEDGTGGGDVGGDEGAMREEVGIEDEKSEGDESGFQRKHLASCRKDEQSEGEREDGSGESRAQQDDIGVVMEKEVVSAEKRLVFEEAALERRHIEVHSEQR